MQPKVNIVDTEEVYDLNLYDQEIVRGNSDYHLRDVRKWVGDFAEAFPERFSRLPPNKSTPGCRSSAVILEQTQCPRSRHRVLQFCQQKDYLPKGIDHAALGTSPFKDRREVITLEEELSKPSNGSILIPRTK